MTLPAVLVTGAAKRLGEAIVRRFAAADWHVVIHCHVSADAAHALAAQLPSAEVRACDLSDDGAASAMVEDLAHTLPDWRALINSASLFLADDAVQLDPTASEAMMRVNARAPARMAQAYLASAKSAAGRRVVQITDQKIANPNPDFFSYTMSKHALAATVPMLAMAAKPTDRIYGLAPGAILPSYDQTAEEAEISHRMNLLQRRTTAAELAEAAYFLATGPLASGQTVFVDSGQHVLSQARDVMYLAREEISHS